VVVVGCIRAGYLMEHGNIKVLMQQAGLRPDQVSQVRGFADQRLRNLKDALDPANRRVSIIVQYTSAAGEPEQGGKETGEEPSSNGKSMNGKSVERQEQVRARERFEAKKEAGHAGQPGRLLSVGSANLLRLLMG
jgi:hypothetical protein